MKSVTLLLLLILTVACTVSSPGSGNKSIPGAKAMVSEFYEAYIAELEEGQKTSKELPYTESFQKLLETNRQILVAAHGDFYLDTKNRDPKLKPESSKIQFDEPVPGMVDVFFNGKKIRLLFIEEKGDWLLNDIQYPEESARHLLTVEKSKQ